MWQAYLDAHISSPFVSTYPRAKNPFLTLSIDGSEGLLVYVCTKQSREEIAAVEQRQKEELEHLVSMRTQNKHAVDRRHKGVMPANLIVHARYDCLIESRRILTPLLSST